MRVCVVGSVYRERRGCGGVGVPVVELVHFHLLMDLKMSLIFSVDDLLQYTFKPIVASVENANLYNFSTEFV
jgi:hypothetical protein